MRVIFLRHGKRDYGYGDTALNEEGRGQSLAISHAPELGVVKTIYSSPKIRTLETVMPLSECLGLKIETKEALDQLQPNESMADFVLRTQSFLTGLEVSSPSSPILLSTHSDWLQAAIMDLNSDILSPEAESFFNCAEFKTFEVVDGLWKLL